MTAAVADLKAMSAKTADASVAEMMKEMEEKWEKQREQIEADGRAAVARAHAEAAQRNAQPVYIQQQPQA